MSTRETAIRHLDTQMAVAYRDGRMGDAQAFLCVLSEVEEMSDPEFDERFPHAIAYIEDHYVSA